MNRKHSDIMIGSVQIYYCEKGENKYVLSNVLKALFKIGYWNDLYTLFLSSKKNCRHDEGSWYT